MPTDRIRIAAIACLTALFLLAVVVACFIFIRLSNVDARLRSIEKRFVELEERHEKRIDQNNALLSSIKYRESRVCATLSDNVVALGVSYQDTSGSTKAIWIGTGFVIQDVEYCATAAHVIEQLEHQESDLTARGLNPTIIAKFSDNSTAKIVNLRKHDLFPSKANRDSSMHYTDVGLFETDPSPSVEGLAICRDHPIVKVGDDVCTAGFPNAVGTIKYPQKVDSKMLPTIRIGRVERITDLQSGFDPSGELIQHNLPLVGGFSGAPIVNMAEEVIGVATVSSFRFIDAKEVPLGKNNVLNFGPTRLLDAANINFAISAIQIVECAGEVTR